MSKKLLAVVMLLIILLNTSKITAESTDVKEVIGGLIKDGKIEEASQKIEEYLIKYPKDVDVLMMKGNVVLNQRIRSGISLNVNDNESIYDSTIAFSSPRIIVIPKEVAEEVAGYWKEGIVLDSSRDDIYKGLCWIYAQAMMKDELIDWIVKLKEAFPDTDGLMYIMGDYAQMLKERRQLEMAFEVYHKIIELYPDEAGIISDLAGEYFNNGTMDKAQQYIKLALTKKNADRLVFSNAFFIQTILGEYDNALEALKSLSNLINSNDWHLYNGLLLYLRDDPQWSSEINEYLKKTTDKTNEKDKALASFLVSKENKNDFASYLKSIEISNSVYQLLLHKRAMNKFPTKFEPFFNYADYLTYFKNYQESIQILQYLENEKISCSRKQKDNLNFTLAWALQDSRNTLDANQKWLILTENNDFYIKSAAIYFYGKNLLDQGNSEEALKMFKKVSDDANKSKYATYCWNLVNKFEKGKH